MEAPLSLLYPALAQILWTLIVILLAGRARIAAIRAKDVTIGQVALSNDAWPKRARAFGNNMNNQFETPVLFYALCGIATYAGATGGIMTGLAWLYVATRVIHTLIHTGGNNVFRRFQAFVAGIGALVAMWFGVVARLLSAG